VLAAQAVRHVIERFDSPKCQPFAALGFDDNGVEAEAEQTSNTKTLFSDRLTENAPGLLMNIIEQSNFTCG
jgi:hypothetical protein